MFSLALVGLFFSILSGISLNFATLYCPEPCIPGERNIRSDNCGKLVELGEQCQPGPSSRLQCKTAFSSCQNGTCRCMHGFNEEDYHCVPETAFCMGVGEVQNPQKCRVFLDDCRPLYCSLNPSDCRRPPPIQGPPSPPSPGGGLPGRPGRPGPGGGLPGPLGRPDPVGKPGVGEESSIADRLVRGFGCLPRGHSPLYIVARDGRTKRHDPTETKESSCPKTHYCSVYSAYEVKECKLVAYGHCCPHSCPIGLPHPTATCERGAEDPCSAHEGYYCRRSFLNEESLHVFGNKIDQKFLATCCPSHCPPNMIALNDGHCTPKADHFEACWRDEQCPYSFQCIKGRCQCPPGTRLQTRKEPRLKNFSSFHERCTPLDFSDGKRYPHLGMACENINGVCGPENSFCTGRKCECACGLEKERNDNNCVWRRHSKCPRDKDSRCSVWAKTGECTKNPDWMKINCATSCDSC